MTGVLAVSRDALANRGRDYPFVALARLRSVLEGLDASLQECEADVSDDAALDALLDALTEALDGET